MRAIWSGSISFGLVNIPVKVFSATENKSISGHMVDIESGSRIRYRKVKEGTSDEVPNEKIATQYESESGKSVILSANDISTLPSEKTKDINITKFIPAAQVDPIYYDKAYFLSPEGKSTKAYYLLVSALSKAGLLAVTEFTIHSKTHIAALREYRGALALHTLHWPDEIREPEISNPNKPGEISADELKLADTLINTLTGDFNPSEYHDNFRDELRKLIEAKALNGDSSPDWGEEDLPEVASDDVADLIAKLEASLKANGAVK